MDNNIKDGMIYFWTEVVGYPEKGMSVKIDYDDIIAKLTTKLTEEYYGKLIKFDRKCTASSFEPKLYLIIDGQEIPDFYISFGIIEDLMRVLLNVDAVVDELFGIIINILNTEHEQCGIAEHTRNTCS